jgi:hypothetical protein
LWRVTQLRNHGLNRNVGVEVRSQGQVGWQPFLLNADVQAGSLLDA